MAYTTASVKKKDEDLLDGSEEEFAYEMLVEKYGEQNVVLRSGVTCYSGERSQQTTWDQRGRKLVFS